MIPSINISSQRLGRNAGFQGIPLWPLSKWLFDTSAKFRIEWQILVHATSVNLCRSIMVLITVMPRAALFIICAVCFLPFPSSGLPSYEDSSYGLFAFFHSLLQGLRSWSIFLHNESFFLSSFRDLIELWKEWIGFWCSYLRSGTANKFASNKWSPIS